MGVVVYGRHGDKQGCGTLHAFECSCIFVGKCFWLSWIGQSFLCSLNFCMKDKTKQRQKIMRAKNLFLPFFALKFMWYYFELLTLLQYPLITLPNYPMTMRIQN